jgi:hypothetical protein
MVPTSSAKRTVTGSFSASAKFQFILVISSISVRSAWVEESHMWPVISTRVVTWQCG